MSTMFQTASPKLQKLDPLKRVNYTFGLVLGVEEFLQSDTYFLAKHHLENRLLHGYGTACGLDVIGQTAPQLEVQVTPGWAINPKGQNIYVSQLMCVQVNNWLQANLAALQTVFGNSAPASLKLCVVLCYRECKTDVVPIPGEPCQSQSSSMAPSRIADSFELLLCLDGESSPPLGSPPSSTSGLCVYDPVDSEDQAARALVQLLAELQVPTGSPPSGSLITIQQLEQLVRDLIPPTSSPWQGSPPSGSPPAGPPYHVTAQQRPEFLRAALRTWVTEVRPFLGKAQGSCCPPPERCVLLADLTLALTPAWVATNVTVDDSRRPFLVPTRVLEEMTLAGIGAGI